MICWQDYEFNIMNSFAKVTFIHCYNSLIIFFIHSLLLFFRGSFFWHQKHLKITCKGLWR